MNLARFQEMWRDGDWGSGNAWKRRGVIPRDDVTAVGGGAVGGGGSSSSVGSDGGDAEPAQRERLSPRIYLGGFQPQLAPRITVYRSTQQVMGETIRVLTVESPIQLTEEAERVMTSQMSEQVAASLYERMRVVLSDWGHDTQRMPMTARCWRIGLFHAAAVLEVEVGNLLQTFYLNLANVGLTCSSHFNFSAHFKTIHLAADGLLRGGDRRVLSRGGD